MTRILNDFVELMASHHDAPWIGQAQPLADIHVVRPLPRSGFVDVTFVDDVAVLMHAPSNDEVCTIAKAVTECFARAAAKA